MGDGRMSTALRVLVAAIGASAALALNTAPAQALSKNTFSTAFAGSGTNALSNPSAVAIEESTGDVYVTNSPIDEQQTITVNATGGTFTLSFEGQTTGATGTGTTTAGSTEITVPHASVGSFLKGEAISGAGIPAGARIAAIAPSGALKLSTEATASGTAVPLTANLPFGASGETVGRALVALSSIGNDALGGIEGMGEPRVKVSGGNPYTVEFTGALGRADQPQITADAAGLSGGASTVQIATARNGSSRADVEKFNPAGEFVLMLGREVNKTMVEAQASQAEQDVCSAESGNECQPGAPGTTPGAFTEPRRLAVDNSCSLREPPLTGAACEAFDPSYGDVYVGDSVSGEGSGDVQKFDRSGNLVSGWGKGGLLDGTNATDGHTFAGASNGFGLTGIAVDPAGKLFVFSDRRYFEFAQDGGFLSDFVINEGRGDDLGLAVDAEDNLYSILGLPGRASTLQVFKLSAAGEYLGDVVSSESTHYADLGMDPLTRDLYLTLQNGQVEHFAPSCLPTRNNTPPTPCTPVDTFGSGNLADPKGVAIDHASGAVYVADAGNHRVAVFTAVPYLPDATASAKPLTPTSESLGGSVDPAGAGPVTGCHFEWGSEERIKHLGGTITSKINYTNTVPCSPDPASANFTAPTAVVPNPAVSGLAAGSTYHYRLVAEDGTGSNASFDRAFTTLPEAPKIEAESVSAVHADGALVHVQIDPGGGEATYHTAYRVEYVSQEQFDLNGFSEPFSSPSLDAGSAKIPQSLTAQLSGLTANTTYRYRVLATNASSPPGGTIGPERTFTTLPFAATNEDSCANAHVRQQTGASPLLDCRAYELVSAADTAGYDVESNLIAGQTPFGSFPQADGRVLYGVHDGGIPGTGSPTNRGVDPYVASRGKGGWTTAYVGIPANATALTAPFSSTLLGADPRLETFAFGGPEICAPCFSEGIETGVPLRLPNGELTQGMVAAPSVPTPPVTATADGYVAKPLSADGAHLLFGSTTQFEAGGNNANGNVSIYDRNLSTGETHVVSKSPSGAKLPCLQGTGLCHSPGDPNGIAALDVSNNGSHVLLAQKVSTDAEGNVYWHLYMNIGDSNKTIDLTPGIVASPGGPGFSEGVLFDGMSADGSKVFFTTKDPMTTATNKDTDTSADLYEAEVSEESSTATLTRISTGAAGAGNIDACNPVASKDGAHWNTVGSEAGCGVVAIGGGGGVAAGDGSIYFLSPETLTSCGCAEPLLDPVQNQPNLYLARPGSPPRFIATLEPNNPLVLDAVKEAGTRHTADFQVTPSGEFAAFPSSLELLPETETAKHTAIYRYDAGAETLVCVSCSPTGAASEGDAGLASNGLSLTDDGRVFFNSEDQLAASDTDNRRDVYQWEPQGAGNCTSSSLVFGKATGTCLALISAGTGSFDSGLLGAGANGKDAYFFTRDSLVPQDKNGPTVKIYDAREEGGFPYTPPEVQCQASDECHGAGSAGPGPVEIGSLAGSEGNVAPEKHCKKGFVNKGGKCVKRHPHKHKSRHHKRGGRR
jgi:NHL repeat